MHAVIRNISEHLKTNQQIPCYYDPSEQQDTVLLTRLYDHSFVLHALLWPSCMLTGGALIIVMVKLTQYLSRLCEEIGKIKRWSVQQLRESSTRWWTWRDRGCWKSTALLWPLAKLLCWQSHLEQLTFPLRTFRKVNGTIQRENCQTFSWHFLYRCRNYVWILQNVYDINVSEFNCLQVYSF